MRRSTEFSSVVRGGARARRGAIVVHYRAPSDTVAGQPAARGEQPARVGLVVGRGVGDSVRRHRVSRRLRAQLAQRLDRLPDGSAVVVRALPGAATASSAQLGNDLDTALDRLGRGSA